MVESIIFDLDGTLWNASATCALAWNHLLKNEGSAYVMDESTIRGFSGISINDIFSKHLPFIPKDRKEEILNTYKDQELIFMKNHGGILYPAVPAVLEDLAQSFRLFIVSNCLAGYIETFLNHTGLQHLITDFESSGKTGLTKSENIASIIERNKIKETVYVGDTIWDSEAAAVNNIPFIYAAYGFGEVTNPSVSISTFSELPEVIFNLKVETFNYPID